MDIPASHVCVHAFRLHPAQTIMPRRVLMSLPSIAIAERPTSIPLADGSQMPLHLRIAQHMECAAIRCAHDAHLLQTHL